MPRRQNPPNAVDCESCGLVFSHRSSLARHLRNTCSRERGSPQRQKSCSQCALDKARCSLDRPKCERCRSKGAQCRYVGRGGPRREISPPEEGLDVQANTTNHAESGEALASTVFDCNDCGLETQNVNSDDMAAFSLFPLAGGSTPPSFLNPKDNAREYYFPFSVTGLTPPTASTSFTNSPINVPDFLDNTSPFDHLALIGGYNIPAVPAPFLSSPSTRQLATNSQPGPNSKVIRNSMELILRVLRSWPGMLADGFQYPPLFHHTQAPPAWSDGSSYQMPAPLANCITISKMWHGQLPGAETLVQDTILREVDVICDGFHDSDASTQLCILQVLVIYAILILSPSKGWRSVPSVETALFARIGTIGNVMGDGLYPQEEKEAIRSQNPQFGWSDWVYVTAKRRAFLSLYLLHWAYSMFHGTQSFDCREFCFMPAPASKVLWQARTQEEWGALYGKWRERWKGNGFLQGEFEAIKPGIVLEERAEKWLAETDEFGFIMMGIVNATDFQGNTTA